MKKGTGTEKDKVILLSHGDGGARTAELINDIVKKHFKNEILDKLEDSAIFNCSDEKIAFTTDSFVVDPIFFPGGDIGKLSICGTINDLVTSGCTPYALSLALILEEGFPLGTLKKIIISMKSTLNEINNDGDHVKIVTGDTKVVGKGSVDKIYINTSGIGFIKKDVDISPSNIKPGDLIILNGTIGDHGIAVLSKRESFGFRTGIRSDCAPLSSLISDVLSATGKVSALRDATRGGLARVLIELSGDTKLDFEIDINQIPINKETAGICEFLGMDPLYIANEGKMVLFVRPDAADEVLQVMKTNKYGKDSRIIGKVLNKGEGIVALKTEIGTRRILDLHYSEQLPRIC